MRKVETKKVPRLSGIGPLVAEKVSSDHGRSGLGDNMTCHTASVCIAVWNWLRCALLVCFADLLLRNLFCFADLALCASWEWTKLLIS